MNEDSDCYRKHPEWAVSPDDMGNSVSAIDDGTMVSITRLDSYYYADKDEQSIGFFDSDKDQEVINSYSCKCCRLCDECQDIEERIHEAADSKIYDEYGTNLNLAPDKKKIYYTDTDMKICVLDINTLKSTAFEALSNYKVKHMYLVNEEKILFQSEGRVYIYLIDKDKIYYTTEFTDVEMFMPTSKGIIYKRKNGVNFEYYVDKVLRFSDIGKKVDCFCVLDDLDKSGEYIYYVTRDKDNISRDYAITIDNFFDLTSAIKLIDYMEYQGSIE